MTRENMDMNNMKFMNRKHDHEPNQHQPKTFYYNDTPSWVKKNKLRPQLTTKFQTHPPHQGQSTPSAQSTCPSTTAARSAKCQWTCPGEIANATLVTISEHIFERKQKSANIKGLWVPCFSNFFVGSISSSEPISEGTGWPHGLRSGLKPSWLSGSSGV